MQIDAAARNRHGDRRWISADVHFRNVVAIDGDVHFVRIVGRVMRKLHRERDAQSMLTRQSNHRVLRKPSPFIALRVSLERINAADGKEAFVRLDRKSTRLNSSHTVISYAVFCLKKKIAAIQLFMYQSPSPRVATEPSPASW